MSESLVAVIRAKLDFPDRIAFIQGFAPLISAGGMFVRTKQLKPVGSTVRFDFRLKSGERLLLGEGVVKKVKEGHGARRKAGMVIRFTKLNRATKTLVDDIIAYKTHGVLPAAESGSDSESAEVEATGPMPMQPALVAAADVAPVQQEHADPPVAESPDPEPEVHALATAPVEGLGELTADGEFVPHLGSVSGVSAHGGIAEPPNPASRATGELTSAGHVLEALLHASDSDSMDSAMSGASDSVDAIDALMVPGVPSQDVAPAPAFGLELDEAEVDDVLGNLFGSGDWGGDGILPTSGADLSADPKSIDIVGAMEQGGVSSDALEKMKALQEAERAALAEPYVERGEATAEVWDGQASDTGELSAEAVEEIRSADHGIEDGAEDEDATPAEDALAPADEAVEPAADENAAGAWAGASADATSEGLPPVSLTDSKDEIAEGLEDEYTAKPTLPSLDSAFAQAVDAAGDEWDEDDDDVDGAIDALFAAPADEESEAVAVDDDAVAVAEVEDAPADLPEEPAAAEGPVVEETPATDEVPELAAEPAPEEEAAEAAFEDGGYIEAGDDEETIRFSPVAMAAAQATPDVEGPEVAVAPLDDEDIEVEIDLDEADVAAEAAPEPEQDGGEAPALEAAGEDASSTETVAEQAESAAPVAIELDEESLPLFGDAAARLRLGAPESRSAIAAAIAETAAERELDDFDLDLSELESDDDAVADGDDAVLGRIALAQVQQPEPAADTAEDLSADAPVSEDAQEAVAAEPTDAEDDVPALADDAPEVEAAPELAQPDAPSGVELFSEPAIPASIGIPVIPPVVDDPVGELGDLLAEISGKKASTQGSGELELHLDPDLPPPPSSQDGPDASLATLLSAAEQELKRHDEPGRPEDAILDDVLGDVPQLPPQPKAPLQADSDIASPPMPKKKKKGLLSRFFNS